MKRIWTLLLFASMVLGMQAQKKISYIEETKNWYYVSDVGEIVGVSGNTITSRKGSWILTWNKDGKKVNSRSAN